MAEHAVTIRERSAVQTYAAVVGAAFLLIGILGFIPGITTHYGDMSFLGHNSEAKLLAIFQVSILHNIVHLLFGVAGLALARMPETARTYLVGGGVVYLALFVYGLFFHGGQGANFVPVNPADNILHVALGAGMILLGVTATRTVMRERTTAA